MTIGSEYLFVSIFSRNLGPYEHVSLQTLCQSGKKDLLNLRRWEGRSSSVAESFSAGAALQRCIVTRHTANPWLHGQIIDFVLF